MSLLSVRRCTSTKCEIELWYETAGELNPARDNAIVLIMGLNGSLAFWPREFVAALVARGLYVILFDNRDAGKSTHLDELGTYCILCLACCPCCSGDPVYDMKDFVMDGAALLEKLGVARYHICGQSMGGMIAQTWAAMMPDRVRSAALIYTSDGHPDQIQPTLSIKLSMAKKPRDGSREAYIDNMLEMALAATFVPEGVYDKEWLSEFFGRVYDHSTYIDGLTRQAIAIVKQKPRSELCKTIKVPCTILHGKLDQLVDPSHSERLHSLIPNSTLVMFDDGGHGIVPALTERYANAIFENTQRATAVVALAAGDGAAAVLPAAAGAGGGASAGGATTMPASPYPPSTTSTAEPPTAVAAADAVGASASNENGNGSNNVVIVEGGVTMGDGAAAASITTTSDEAPFSASGDGANPAPVANGQ